MNPLPAQVSDPVWYYPAGDTNAAPYAAIVSAVYTPDIVDLNVITPDGRSMILAQGCHHKDDPSCNDHDRQSNGAWDHTERTKVLARVAARVFAAKQKGD